MSHFLLYLGPAPLRLEDDAFQTGETVRQTPFPGGLVGSIGPLAEHHVSGDAGRALTGVQLSPAPITIDPRTPPLQPGAPSQYVHLPEPDGPGHFAAVAWNGSRVTGGTDRAGLRSLYVAPFQGGHLISSHLPTLARLTGRNEPDPDVFSSHWLLQNQLGRESLVEGITRICGARFELMNGKPSVSPYQPAHPAPQNTVPSRETGPPDDPAPLMASYLGENTTLGLSGGLDSRLLLALAPEGQALHTFGDGADAMVATRIARKLGTDLARIAPPLPDAHELAGLLRDTNNATTPASFSARRPEFRQALREGRLLVDGGFGEYGRRVFMGRLIHTGRLRRISPESALELLRFDRGSFFRPEIERLLYESARRAVQNVLPLRPDGAWADAMGLRHRLPNFFGYEQECLDGIGPALMPFAQPDVIRALSALPERERAGGRWFRRTIRARRPELARIPLVKGAHEYPFWMGPMVSRTWLRLTSGRATAAHPRRAYLEAMRPFLMDRIASTDVHSWFDPEALQVAADGYYRGQEKWGASIDWWLSLDAWFRSLRA